MTATVRDASGIPVPDTTVAFAASFTSRSGVSVTGWNGEATFCYTSELAGTDSITAFADFDPKNGARDPTEPGGAATKEWLAPVTGPHCVVRSQGTIVAQNGDVAGFTGRAKVTAGAVSGLEEYQDEGPAQRFAVRSIRLVGVTCSANGTQASIFGKATIEGAGSFAFRIDTRDLGGPGQGADTYRILLQTGYDSGVQSLVGGNVQIRLFR